MAEPEEREELQEMGDLVLQRLLWKTPQPSYELQVLGSDQAWVEISLLGKVPYPPFVADDVLGMSSPSNSI